LADTQVSVSRRVPEREVSLRAAAARDRQETATDYFSPFQRIPVPVHSMGPDGVLLAVNEAWVEYTGHSSAQAVGRSFAEFLDPPSAIIYRQEAVPELIVAVPAHETRTVEYRLIKASGEAADIVLTARPIRDPVTGRFLYSLTVITDITTRNRAETALRQAQKLEALGGLTGGVAHDFNNLLMVISGSLQLLAKRLPADDRRTSRLVDAAMQGVLRGAALTNRLLAFSRQQDLMPGPLDPHHLFDAMRPMVSRLAGAAIALEEDLPPDIWNLHADRNQLELAILNLVGNARDAMPRGGNLRLAARNATVAATLDTPFIQPEQRSAAPAGEYVVLSVRDTGTGMDESALARATDPFFTTKGLGKGAGLGLSMVHGFATQSGGALVLSSRPGSGTTAELWLPRTGEPARQAASAPPVYAGAEPAPSQSLRILLVDDDPLIVEGTTAMLEELGHEPAAAAASAEEALAILRSDDGFDLLLTDHLMPGMTGVQLAARVRTLHPSLPILLASGFAELDELANVTCPRLRKPYSLSDLSAALRIAARQPY
jgi:PAS domain S-box-containing protein